MVSQVTDGWRQLWKPIWSPVKWSHCQHQKRAKNVIWKSILPERRFLLSALAQPDRLAWQCIYSCRPASREIFGLQDICAKIKKLTMCQLCRPCDFPLARAHRYFCFSERIEITPLERMPFSTWSLYSRSSQRITRKLGLEWSGKLSMHIKEAARLCMVSRCLPFSADLFRKFQRFLGQAGCSTA